MRAHLTRQFSILIGVLALSACGGNGTGAPVQQGNQLIPVERNAADTAHKSSWIDRDADTQDLLYVSDAKDGSVYVYSYPEGKPAGALFHVKASGLCSNAEGDVFIPKGNEVLEYAHGGTRPLAVLRDPLGGATQFCAVDRRSGNLAVSGGTSHRYGVAIYTNAKGDPRTVLGDDRNSRYGSCTYDGKGNLFVAVTGGKSYGSSRLVELSNGNAQVREITWNGTRHRHLGSIQWDGKYLAAASPASGSEPAILFRYAIHGRQATLVGKTALPGVGSPFAFWIEGTQVVVPNQGADRSRTGIALYGYPQGNKTGQIDDDALAPIAAALSAHKFAVITYHYDNKRTGWNNQESVLTTGNVNSGSFGLLQTVTLDDQVDAQPLIVPNENTTTGVTPGKHDVAYVATEHNSVYAIDASSGTVLFQKSLGTPVPTPLKCGNSGPYVGINSTPVIDRAANIMYAIAYTMQGTVPTYLVHELNLSNLTDIVTPVVISASHTLSDGSTYTFNATYQRQRAGLLESSGNIYAGFASFCDFSASKSRGWVLGWQAGSLTPLPANKLNDVLATSPNSFFLSSVWMSGYGISADAQGNVYFATGNSDPSGTTYSSATNISESVVEMSPDLSTVASFFTPFNVNALDVNDEDTGSGGVMVLPNGSGAPYAAAAGKAGTLFLLSRKNLGGYNAGGPNHDLAEASIGACWCGLSYFDAATDSIPRIVGSGAKTVTVWQVTNTPSLVAAGKSAAIPSGQDPGFFTTVSSNGSSAGAIIWAVSHAQSFPGSVTLFAFTAQPPSGSSTLQTLYQAAAGTWATKGGNANIVPVVANGKVYVASYQQLNIFGLLPPNSPKREAPLVAAPSPTMGFPHEITGTLVAINGAQLALRTRTGNIVGVDDSIAVRQERNAVLVPGQPYTAGGNYNGEVLHATVIWRAKPSTATWPADY